MSTIRIAVDAMGGDKAPGVNLLGARLALGVAPDLSIILVGDRNYLLKEFPKYKLQENERLSLIHAPEVISMDDHAASIVRKKKDSSIHVGMRLVKEGKAHAFLSAGNSGAVMACALLILGRLSEVERPAIVVRLPTATGFSILLDAGANVDCRASHLVQFAEMGAVYATLIDKIEKPKVGILSNGEESHKGNDLTREADSILKTLNQVNYVGYVEGNDLFKGTADVIISDGFVGNVVLKTVEGFAETVFKWFRREIKKDWLGLVGVLLMGRVLRKFKKKFDYQPVGGVPLLGIDGLAFISHGSSTKIAIQNGILAAKKAVEEDFLKKISTSLVSDEKKERPSQ